MSIAMAQAQKFYEQVVREGRVFTFDESDDLLVFHTSARRPTYRAKYQ